MLNISYCDHIYVSVVVNLGRKVEIVTKCRIWIDTESVTQILGGHFDIEFIIAILRAACMCKAQTQWKMKLFW